MTILRKKKKKKEKKTIPNQTRPFNNHLDNTSYMYPWRWKVSRRWDNINKAPYIRAILIDMSMWQVANGYSARCNAPIVSFPLSPF